jgi:hypothetical protein
MLTVRDRKLIALSLRFLFQESLASQPRPAFQITVHQLDRNQVLKPTAFQPRRLSTAATKSRATGAKKPDNTPIVNVAATVGIGIVWQAPLFMTGTEKIDDRN